MTVDPSYVKLALEVAVMLVSVAGIIISMKHDVKKLRGDFDEFRKKVEEFMEHFISFNDPDPLPQRRKYDRSQKPATRKR